MCLENHLSYVCKCSFLFYFTQIVFIIFYCLFFVLLFAFVRLLYANLFNTELKHGVPLGWGKVCRLGEKKRNGYREDTGYVAFLRAKSGGEDIRRATLPLEV